MASRNRARYVRYGGRICGTQNGVAKTEDAYVGIQRCIDETHPGPPYRSGGPLSVTKKQVFIDRATRFTSNYGGPPASLWTGYMYVKPYIPSPEPTGMSLVGWGAKGWNRTYPLHPIYSLGVSIGEVRDLPRMLTQTWKFFQRMRGLSLTRIPKTLGDFIRDVKKGTVETSGDYLNLQFGWVPFAQDLAFLAKMENKLRQKISWLRKHNRRSFRRRIELDSGGFSEDVARSTTIPGTMGPTLQTQNYSGNVATFYPIPCSKTYNRRIWFSSKWRIYMPELDDPSLSLRKLKAQLAGIDLDASIIYNLVPWSWLMDWFTNVGDVLQNISLRGRHQVVAEYAYVMCRETYEYGAPGYVDMNIGTYNQPTSGKWSGGQRRFSGRSTTRYTFAQREAANPFGFGITYASLSLYQLSILAALGLSRGGKKLALRT